jgi:quercetin dioxygenase-like cupin family protein
MDPSTTIQGNVHLPGEAPGVRLRGTQVDFLATAVQSKHCSMFEFHVAPGFDTGSHYHTRIEEIFYVLAGQLTMRVGERVVQGGPGTSVFIPIGVVHSFGNSGSDPVPMLLLAMPGGHEHYFDELVVLLARPGPPDPVAIAALRLKYDTVQVSGLAAAR